jgi:hypothetical protein
MTFDEFRATLDETPSEVFMIKFHFLPPVESGNMGDALMRNKIEPEHEALSPEHSWQALKFSSSTQVWWRVQHELDIYWVEANGDFKGKTDEDLTDQMMNWFRANK